MKPSAKSILICLLASILSLPGDGLQLETKDTTEVQNKLEAYTKGELGLEDVSNGEEWGMKVIAYHVTHSNDVTVKMKLPIARCYAIGSIYSNSVRLTTEYLNVYTNDARAWDLLSGAQLAQGSVEEGLAAGTNALRFGCERNIAATGLAALQLDRLDVFEGMIVRRLLMLKDAVETPTDKRREMINVLVIYSLKANKKEMFLKGVEGVDTAMVRADSKLKSNIELGLEEFGPKDTEKIRNKIFPTKVDDKTIPKSN